MSKTYHDLLRQLPEAEVSAAQPQSGYAFELKILKTLLDLMQHSESDSVRVSAARTLIDKIREESGSADEDTLRAEQERAAAIAEITELLAELAAVRTDGAAQSAAVAAAGAAKPADPLG